MGIELISWCLISSRFNPHYDVMGVGSGTLGDDLLNTSNTLKETTLDSRILGDTSIPL